MHQHNSLRKRFQGSSLLLPAVIPILLFSAAPILYGISLSLTDARAGRRGEYAFVGTANFTQLLDDPFFWNALGVGLVWSVSVTVLVFVLSLVYAMLLDAPLRGRAVFRALAVIPWALPPVVTALTWKLVYHPNAGLVNYTLEELGFGPSFTNWLINPRTALPAVVIAAVWSGLPQTTVVLLAALQAVPRELKEAAAIDRAGRWATFRVVTWPTIRPVVIAITALDFISAFNSFGLVYVLTDGAPGGALRLPALFAYQEAFTYGNFGYSAAIGVAMVLAIAAVLAVSIWTTLRSRKAQ